MPSVFHKIGTNNILFSSLASSHKLKSLLVINMEKGIRQTKQSQYECGGNLGKILQYTIKTPNLRSPIFRIRSKNNAVHSDLAAMNRTFSNFNQRLYSSNLRAQAKEIDSFLDQIDFPQ